MQSPDLIFSRPTIEIALATSPICRSISNRSHATLAHVWLLVKKTQCRISPHPWRTHFIIFDRGRRHSLSLSQHARHNSIVTSPLFSNTTPSSDDESRHRTHLSVMSRRLEAVSRDRLNNSRRDRCSASCLRVGTWWTSCSDDFSSLPPSSLTTTPSSSPSVPGEWWAATARSPDWYPPILSILSWRCKPRRRWHHLQTWAGGTPPISNRDLFVG